MTGATGRDPTRRLTRTTTVISHAVNQPALSSKGVGPQRQPTGYERAGVGCSGGRCARGDRHGPRSRMTTDAAWSRSPI
jgi:hypothetical protein